MIRTQIPQLRLRWKLLLYLMFVNGIFFVLYHKFLIGNGVYLYDDIGSDAYTSSYPIISMLARLFQNGQFPQYELTAGMGSNIAVTYLQYLNPIKSFLLLFGNETLPVGILLYLLVQTNVTAVGGYCFFLSYTRDDTIAFIPALIWTYSGYTVLWTQNLSFGVCITMVTLLMLSLRYDLMRQNLRTWLILTGVLALFLVTNYYYYYTAGIGAVLFVIGSVLVHHGGVRSLLRALMRLFLAAVGSVLLCACDAFAIISVFFGSSRAAETAGTHSISVFQSPSAILTTLGRLLSPNFFGVGDQYTAYSNYYESACLFAGALLLPALCYLLLTRRTRRRTAILMALSAAALSLTLTGNVLNFSAYGYRYAFLIVFLEVLAVSDFLVELTRRFDRKTLTRSVLLSIAALAALLVSLSKLSSHYGYSVSKRAVLLLLGAFGLYVVILLAVCRSASLLQALPCLLIVAVSLELLSANYDSVNRRSYLTKELYQYSFYNDGTQLAVREIKAQDHDLYRISGDSDIASANGGMVNNYNGTSAYSSTLPKSLIALSQAQNTYEESRNHFLSDYYSYLQFTLLGGRYLIEDGFHQISEGMEPSLMEQTDRIFQPEHGIDKRLFKNKHALPFGYLYTKEASRDAYDALDANERMHLLTEAFYETDGSAEESNTKWTGSHRDTVTKLAASITEAIEAAAEETADGVLLTPLTDGAHVFCAVADTERQEDLHFLHLALQDGAKEARLTVYPLTQTEPLAKESYIRRVTLNSDYPEVSLLLPDALVGLRIDVKSQAALSAFELVTCPGVDDALEALAETDISDIRFENGVYTASVASEHGGMLAVPLIYASEWHAEVNGKPVPVHNINGGLVGVRLNGGTERVTIRYEIAGFSAGRTVSLISAALYLLLWIMSGRMQRRNTR